MKKQEKTFWGNACIYFVCVCVFTLHCGDVFMDVYMSKCIKLYTLNMCIICPLYLNKCYKNVKFTHGK